MTTGVRYALGIVLGAAFYAALSGALAASASAIDVPAIEELGRAAKNLHPPKLELPHVEIPSNIPSDFGTSDQTIITALESDKASEASTVGKAASDVSEDRDEEEKVKKCVADGLLAIVSDVLEVTEPPTVEEAVKDALTPCFDAFVPEGERARELAEYFAKKTTEESHEAYEDANEDPVVFGDWVRSTATTVQEPAPEPEPGPTPEPEPEPEPDHSGGGVSTGVIVALVVVVVGLMVAIGGYRRRRRK